MFLGMGSKMLRVKITPKGVVRSEKLHGVKRRAIGDGNDKIYKEFALPKETNTIPDHVVNEENRNPNIVTPPPTEGFAALNTDISPEKALRVALLKRRFADTIFKATHQSVMKPAADSYSARDQERKRLEKEKIEDKTNIEAEFQAASKKMRLDKEREASRTALQQMRKTVDIYENLEAMMEFERMIGCAPSYDSMQFSTQFFSC